MDLVIGQTGDGDLAIDAPELVTGRTCVIAQSGAGKSWGIAVLCERLCKANIGFCLIDTEGEYFSLRDKFPVLWVGSDAECDENIEKVKLADLMKKAIQCSTAVIFDVSETDMRAKAAALAEILYDLESELRRPYLLIVEEADKFIPQSSESIKKIEEISRRGRKRGLGLLVATQRPSLVVKNVLSQCNSQILGKLSIENDLKAVGHFFGSRKEVEELSALQPGEFFVMGSLSREKVRMKFGSRETKHRGLTPKLMPPGPAKKVRVKSAPCPPEKENGLADAPAAEPLHDVPAQRPHSPDDNAVIPVLLREEALDIARGKCKKNLLTRTFLERIASAELVFWPLLVVEAKFLGGLLRRSTKQISFILDGLQGHAVDLSRGLSMRPGFAELIDLDEAAVRIIATLTPGGSTEPEMEADTRLPPEVVKRAVKQLEKRKLITPVKTAGEASVYVPLLVQKIPRPGSLHHVYTGNLEPLDGISREKKIDEAAIRTVLKGLEPTAEITATRVMYYPVFEVRLASDTGERMLFLDGVFGREIPFQPDR